MSRRVIYIAAASGLVAFLGLGVFAAWLTGEIDWWRARADGSQSAYLRFASRFTNSWHTEEAVRRIVAMDEAAWTQASTENTVDSYRRYLEQCPHGIHGEQATARVVAGR
jgi:hypothetical protein